MYISEITWLQGRISLLFSMCVSIVCAYLVLEIVSVLGRQRQADRSLGIQSQPELHIEAFFKRS